MHPFMHAYIRSFRFQSISYASSCNLGLQLVSSSILIKSFAHSHIHSGRVNHLVILFNWTIHSYQSVHRRDLGEKKISDVSRLEYYVSDVCVILRSRFTSRRRLPFGTENFRAWLSPHVSYYARRIHNTFFRKMSCILYLCQYPFVVSYLRNIQVRVIQLWENNKHVKHRTDLSSFYELEDNFERIYYNYFDIELSCNKYS